MILDVDPQDLEESKRIMHEFDAQKTYNKFNCSHNYIGLLGEMTLHKYLNKVGIVHTWVPFMKKDSGQPDFIIDGKTIDLKTSYGESLWFTSPKYDVYIYCKLSADNKRLDVQRFITREDMLEGMDNGSIRRIPYKTRNDYCISARDLPLISSLDLISA